MWMVAVLAMVLVSSGHGLADDIYRSVDAQGQVDYSNGPTRHSDEGASEDGAQENAGMPADAGHRDDQGNDTGAGAGAAAAPADNGFSTEASLRRSTLERDLRATQKQLKDVDARLEVLSRARTKNAGGSAATSGVGTNAGDMRSEEEKNLATQRQQLAQHVTEVREAASKLKQEVTDRLGATPEWWVDLR